jgi:hypothetical protein
LFIFLLLLLLLLPPPLYYFPVQLYQIYLQLFHGRCLLFLGTGDGVVIDCSCLPMRFFHFFLLFGESPKECTDHESPCNEYRQRIEYVIYICLGQSSEGCRCCQTYTTMTAPISQEEESGITPIGQGTHDKSSD